MLLLCFWTMGPEKSQKSGPWSFDEMCLFWVYFDGNSVFWIFSLLFNKNWRIVTTFYFFVQRTFLSWKSVQKDIAEKRCSKYAIFGAFWDFCCGNREMWGDVILVFRPQITWNIMFLMVFSWFWSAFRFSENTILVRIFTIFWPLLYAAATVQRTKNEKNMNLSFLLCKMMIVCFMIVVDSFSGCYQFSVLGIILF